MGPDMGTWLCNISLFVGLATLFAIYVAYDIHISLVVITAILVAITLWSLFKATFTEAGIIPRQPPRYCPLYVLCHTSSCDD
jgi:predicted lysophospholipase L1 biosynthesis ABC-type transport system permease subunit